MQKKPKYSQVHLISNSYYTVIMPYYMKKVRNKKCWTVRINETKKHFPTVQLKEKPNVK